MKIKHLGILVVPVLLGIGCAHQNSANRVVEEKLQHEPAVAMGGPVAAESRKMIEESPNLTQAQKDRLTALHAQMAGEITKMREDLGKLKMTFFRSFLNPKTEERELRNIRDRIIALDRKKTDRMLTAFEEAKEILGRRSEQDERVFRAFLIDRSQ